MLSSSSTRKRRVSVPAIVLLLLLATGCSGGASGGPDFGRPPPDTPMGDPERQTELLDNASAQVRYLAAKNLGLIGAESSPAIPKLETLEHSDPDPKVRRAAAKALKQIQAALE